jgi:hypothetical protein
MAWCCNVVVLIALVLWQVHGFVAIKTAKVYHIVRNVTDRERTDKAF